MNHEDYLKRALELATKAEGRTSPNPMVGAVIVKDGEIIGEGFHTRAGQPHAEVEALRACTQDPAGATAYVSLEPCCHFGKTPPCAQALIEAKIAEVHYAVPDDNPRVSGGGHKMLVDAGIRVVQGPFEAEGRHLIRHFFTYIKEKRCHITAKYAMTLDGKIATRTQDSQWITGPAARGQGHLLRNLSDAIIVGAGTVRADNPSLTTRLEDQECHHPTRVILDSRGTLKLNTKILSPDLPGQTILATTDKASPTYLGHLKKQGVESMILAATSDGRIDLIALTKELAKRGMMRVMVEGGAQVLGAFHDANLIDETWTFIGPKLIGGTKAPGPLAGNGVATIKETALFDIYETSTHGNDILIKATRI